MKCKLKSFYYVLISLLCFVLVLPNFMISSYASTTSSGVDRQKVSDYIAQHNFYGICADICKDFASFPNWAGDNNQLRQAYIDWLEQKALDSYLDEYVELGLEEGTSGGRGYNIPQEVRQSVVDFVKEEYIEQNPLGYSQCYIYSYNMVNVQQFPTYALYSTFKEWASQQDGYILTNPYISGGSVQGIRACVIPKRSGVDFIGTTTEGGFTNVMFYIDWSARNTPWQYVSGSKWVQINNNGSISDFNGSGQTAQTLGNTSSFNSGVQSRMTIFSSLPKNEMVYVFNTLNALKAYNSGSPQSYYLPSGSTDIVPYSDILTDSSILGASGYYNSIVDNSVSGWTPEQVLALVDRIMSQNGNSGSGSGDGSSDNPFGFLGRLGELIGQLVGGVGDLLTSIVDGVVSIFLGAEDENGVRSGGLFGTIRDLLTQISSIFDANIGQFVSDVFGWLPTEIITLWTAGIFIAILFGILRIIRG